MPDEVMCAVPGCNNTLTDEQRNKKIVVCSSCEAAKMHLCESCSKQISGERIRNGATLCRECEMNPTDLEEPATDMMDYEDEYVEGTGEEEEEFMV